MTAMTAEKKKILYSPGYGAGWSTWNSGEVGRYMATYQPIIDFIEEGGKFDGPHPLLLQLQQECLEKFGEEYICLLGASDLQVYTCNDDIQAYVHEYDGSESIRLRDSMDWI